MNPRNPQHGLHSPALPRRRALTRPRKQLPFEDWPQADQVAWHGLFREGDLLASAGTGTARHWSAGTRRTNLKHYARWLGWCAATGRLSGDGAPVLGASESPPWGRATPEAVEAFARALLTEVAPKTVASGLIGLKCVLRVMAPEADWAWLKRLTNRLKSWATPSRPFKQPDLSAPEMFDVALGELERLSDLLAPTVRERQVYRDTLIVALLLACPIRLRNLAMMEVNRHLIRLGEAWHLRFEPQETKTGQAVHLVVPGALTPFFDDYLTCIRPRFPGAQGHLGLWAAQKGRPMAEETIYASVRQTSQRLFGAALNPHAFRTVAATLLAETSPEDALHARPLLGHRQAKTTEKHYVRASQLSAAWKVAEVLQEIRDGDVDADLETMTETESAEVE